MLWLCDNYLICTYINQSHLLTVFSQQSHVAGVSAPHHVLDLGDLDGGQRAFLLHVEQRDAVSISQQQGTRSCVEDFLAARHLHFLHNFILQVLNQQLWKRGHVAINGWRLQHLQLCVSALTISKVIELILCVCVCVFHLQSAYDPVQQIGSWPPRLLSDQTTSSPLALLRTECVLLSLLSTVYF